MLHEFTLLMAPYQAKGENRQMGFVVLPSEAPNTTAFNMVQEFNLMMIDGKAQNACINKDYVWRNIKCSKG